MKTKLIPSIVEKWPTGDRASQQIHIQQDGAKVHIDNKDPEFLEELTRKGINAELSL